MSLGSEKQEIVPQWLSKAAQKFTKLFRERARLCGVKPLNVSILHVVAVNMLLVSNPFFFFFFFFFIVLHKSLANFDV